MSLLPLQQIPQVSARDRVLSFISDQKRRLPRFAADGLAAVTAPLHDLETLAVVAPPSAQIPLNTPLLVPRAAKPRESVPAAAPSKSTGEEKTERLKERRAPPPFEPVDEHAERLAERRERRRERREILHPKPAAGISKRKRASESNESGDEVDNRQAAKRKKSAANKKSASLLAGMALMQNFSAPNVANGRLTLANHAGSASGVFSKGRASAKTETKSNQVARPEVRRGPLFDEHTFLNRKPLVPIGNSSPQKSNSVSSLGSSRKQSRLAVDSSQPSRHHGKRLPTPAHPVSGYQDKNVAVTVCPERARSPSWSIELAVDLLGDTGSANAPALSTSVPKTPPTPALPVTPASDGVKSVDTQYRLTLPMCADISGPVSVAKPATAPALTSPSYPATSNIEESAAPAQQWQQRPVHHMSTSPHTLPPHECTTLGDETVAFDILCSDYRDPLLYDEAEYDAADHLLDSINRILDPVDLPPTEQPPLDEMNDGMVLSDDLVMDEFDDAEEQGYITLQHEWPIESLYPMEECEEEEHHWTGGYGGDGQLLTSGDEEFADNEMPRWGFDHPTGYLEAKFDPGQVWASDDLDASMVGGTAYDGTERSEIDEVEGEDEWQEFTEGRALLLLGSETQRKPVEYDEGVKFSWSPYNRA